MFNILTLLALALQPDPVLAWHRAVLSGRVVELYGWIDPDTGWIRHTYSQNGHVYATSDPYGFTVWLNGIRAGYGLAPVRHDAGMAAQAARNNTFGFGHAYCPCRRQNSAWGFVGAVNVGQAWMASAGHRAALLDPSLTVIGIAWDGYSLWTMNGN